MNMPAPANVGAAILLLAVPQAASAYLDPGTGSLILQGLLAAVAGIMVTGRIYWYKLKSFFAPSSSNPAPDEIAEDGGEGPVGREAEAPANERRD